MCLCYHLAITLNDNIFNKIANTSVNLSHAG